MCTDIVSLPSINRFNSNLPQSDQQQLLQVFDFPTSSQSNSGLIQQGASRPQQGQQQQPKRKRVKTGCLTCRKRHRKCDEQHPKCLSCQQKGFQCIWPAKTGVFVNNSQIDYTSPTGDSNTGRRRVGNRIGDRILSTIQQENIPATTMVEMAQPDYVKQRSMSLGTGIYSNNDNGLVLASNGNMLLSKRSNSEFSGLQMDMQYPLHNNLSALDNYSDQLQAISLLPYASTKMDLPSLLNGEDLELLLLLLVLALPMPMADTSTTSDDLSPQTPTNFKQNLDYNSLGDFFLNINPNSECNDYNNLHNILRDFMYLKNVKSENDDLDLFSIPDDIRSMKDLIDINQQYEEPQLNPKVQVELLRNFTMVIAPTLEMFDSNKNFSRVIPKLAMDCPALMYAILAYSLKHLERLNNDYPKDQLMEFYRYSLQQLIPTIKTKTIDLKIVCACVLLCCLEMMSSSPMNWRRHLEGCFALFTSCGINGFSEDSLSRSLFWCFARMDICSSIISENPTIIPIQNWIPLDWNEYNLMDKFTTNNDGDMYANYIVFLCSRVMNLLYNVKSNFNFVFNIEWEKLWNELQEWYLHRPQDMLPILDSSLKEQSFPNLLFTNALAISGNQMYHMAIILMMQNKPRLFKIPVTQNFHSITSHARHIIGISITNRDHGAWINSIQPFWIAGKLINDESERKLILQTIKELEELTGWAIAWRGRDLVEYWNNNNNINI